MTPGSRRVVIGNPLASNTFNIAAFSGRTSAVNSLESVLPGDSREVAHQSPADPLPLVRIVHDKGHFGTALPDHDVTRAADDDRMSVLLQ